MGHRGLFISHSCQTSKVEQLLVAQQAGSPHTQKGGAYPATARIQPCIGPCCKPQLSTRGESTAVNVDDIFLSPGETYTRAKKTPVRVLAGGDEMHASFHASPAMRVCVPGWWGEMHTMTQLCPNYVPTMSQPMSQLCPNSVFSYIC